MCTHPPEDDGAVAEPERRVQRALQATGDSATRGTATRSLGSSRTPACSASLWSGGKSVPVALTCSNSASGVRLIVNSPVASTLRSESLRPTEVNWTTGGSTHATV